MPTVELKDPLRSITIESGIVIPVYNQELLAFATKLAAFDISLSVSTWTLVVQPNGQFVSTCTLKDARAFHEVLRLDLAYPAFRNTGDPSFWLQTEQDLYRAVMNAIIRLIQMFTVTEINMVWV